MGFQWSLYSAVVLLSVHAAHSPRSVQGLSCVNDFVRNVTCTWRRAAFNPGSDCWLSGVKSAHIFKDKDKTRREKKHIIGSCKLQQHGEFPGCTFSFDRTFNPYDKMPNISVKCNNTLVEVYPNYSPIEHIKMQPPGMPNVSSSVNVTEISWNPGNPHSTFFKFFKFEVQIKHIHQSWNEAKNEPTEVPELIIWQKLKGLLQVRVRVKPGRTSGSHWSDWSPITSWVAHDRAASSQKEAVNPGQDSLFLCLTLPLSLGLLSALVLALYRCFIRKRLMKEKNVPNPSKYFCTLHSVHGGNLKKWLNPVSVSDSFFVSRPCEDISAVEVCKSWDGVHSNSPCSTSALLHSPSGDNPCSSCSSSCFSNVDYFMSSYNSSSSRTRTSPNFSYHGNIQSTHRKLQPSLCPPFTSSSIYKTLRREPHSPDSGFGIGRFEDPEMEVLDDNQNSPLLLHLPLSVSSFPPAPPPFPSDVNLAFDNQGLEEDAPTAASPAVCGNLSAWPVAEPMCRASSLPVDACISGYLTLKELQTTFSNKSI